MRSLVDNAASTKQVANAERIEREREKQRRADNIVRANSPENRRKLARDLDTYRVFSPDEETNPARLAANVAERNVILRDLAEYIEAKPDILAVLMEERARELKMLPLPETADVDEDGG